MNRRRGVARCVACRRGASPLRSGARARAARPALVGRRDVAGGVACCWRLLCGVMCDVAHVTSLLRARGGAAAGRRCACARESARELGCSAHARVSVLCALTRASVSAPLAFSRVGDRPVDAPKSAGRRVSPPCFFGCVAPRTGRFPSCSRYASGPGGRVGGSLFVVGALAGPAWEGGEERPPHSPVVEVQVPVSLFPGNSARAWLACQGGLRSFFCSARRRSPPPLIVDAARR